MSQNWGQVEDCLSTVVLLLLLPRPSTTAAAKTTSTTDTATGAAAAIRLLRLSRIHFTLRLRAGSFVAV